MPWSKSIAPQSKSVAPQSNLKSAAPQSKSAASQPVASNKSQITTAREGDQDSEGELAIGGMLPVDEDDSLEQELAMSSPLKGNESCTAKVCFSFIIQTLIDVLSVNSQG